MPDVILIDPSSGQKNSRPQLGTLHLAAMLLQKGIRVELIDFSVKAEGKDLLKKYLASGVVCVGISSVIGRMLSNGLELAEIVRKQRPDVPIVWGGVHPTTAAESTLKHELVDAICIGEGEITFVQMVEAYGNGHRLHDIPGVGFKEKGRLIFTPPRQSYFDLDTLPPLPYHLIDLDLYRIKRKGRSDFFGLHGDQIMSVETSRGCVFRCNYCVNAAKKETFRKMSPENVIRNIEGIIREGVRSVTINDDNFFIDKQRATQILQAIIDHGWHLEIFVAVRSDYLSSIDGSDFELMKKAGVSMLGIGVESGSNRILNNINKKQTIEKTFTANRHLARHGIKAWFHFIYGFPGETVNDFIQTYNAMHRILKENPLHAQVNLNRLIPNPGTPSFQECLQTGWVPPDSIETWATLTDDIFKSSFSTYIDDGLKEWVKRLDHFSFPRDNLPHLKLLTIQRLFARIVNLIKRSTNAFKRLVFRT